MTPSRILLIRSGGLGDFILTLPVVDALRARWPDATLEILGRPAIALLAGDRISRIRSIDERCFAHLFVGSESGGASDPAASYVASFDLVVSFLGTPDSEFGRRLSSLAPRVVFVGMPQANGLHACTQFLDALKPLGIDPPKAVPRVELSREQEEEGERLVQRLLRSNAAGTRIVVHPGSGGLLKNWPPRQFAETIRLLRDAGKSVIVLEGEADTHAVRELMTDIEGEHIPLLREASLLEVAGVIKASQLVIANDSGIAHLAASVGTPLICLFGPTDPNIWRPLGDSVRVLTFQEATPARVFEEAVRLTGNFAS
ncbi:MAG TPA: glycosyltransferase family 9 protein [Acidobacteriota bacterium]|nr:glycosyltransferase family 9 protein [Acidobacteriota bacterium]